MEYGMKCIAISDSNDSTQFSFTCFQALIKYIGMKILLEMACEFTLTLQLEDSKDFQRDKFT